MDYSVKGILVLLQDLQRIHFGKMTILINVYTFEESGPMVNGCVFSNDGEPHNFNFYSDESDEVHKKNYMDFTKIVNETAG